MTDMLPTGLTGATHEQGVEHEAQALLGLLERRDATRRDQAVPDDRRLWDVYAKERGASTIQRYVPSVKVEHVVARTRELLDAREA